MKLVESKVEYLPQEEGLNGMNKHIEKCGRTCYKSENKITEDSATKFLEGIIHNNHVSVLEHGTVYFTITIGNVLDNNSAYMHDIVGFYERNPYSKVNNVKTFPKVNIDGKDTPVSVRSYYITTNFRVIDELLKNKIYTWDEAMIWRVNAPTKYHERRYTFKFICSRGIANELVRHRHFSFAQESSRYCNYSKDKFNNEITFVRPYWAKLNPGPYVITPDMKKDTCNIEGDGYYKELTDTKEEELLLNYMNSERTYLDLLDKGAQPQDAREVLPLGLKTELCMTGFASDWREFLDKRLFEKTGKVHPDMKVLMEKLQKVAEDAGIWEDIMSYHSKY